MDTRNLQEADGILGVKRAPSREYNKKVSTEKLQNRRHKRSSWVSHGDAIVNGGLAGWSQRRACPELSESGVVLLDDDADDDDDDTDNGVGCMCGSLGVLSGQRVIGEQAEKVESMAESYWRARGESGQRVIEEQEEKVESMAHISEGGKVSHVMANKPVMEDSAFRSMLAVEIKRQILSGLRDMRQGTMQDLEVMEVEDIVGCGAERRGSVGSTGSDMKYIAKVKLMATICIPVSLQGAQYIMQTRKYSQRLNEGGKYCARLEELKFIHGKRQDEVLLPVEGEILVAPSKGEVWALYRDRIAFQHRSECPNSGEYELVQVVDMDKALSVVTVMPLLKVMGFRARFVREHWPFKIASTDFWQFSHQIRAWEFKEGTRVYVELDPASAIPLSLSSTPKQPLKDGSQGQTRPLILALGAARGFQTPLF